MEVKYYKNKYNLRAANCEISYTKEQATELIRCKNDREYFIQNYCNIINLKSGKTLFNLRDYQSELVNIYDKYNRLIIKWPRQAGKSVTIAAIAVHEIIFKEYNSVGILANKEKSAKEFIKKIKLMYQNLPIWMQHGINAWNVTSIELENGSKVSAHATSADGIRGDAVNTIIIDETAFIQKNIWVDFYSSVYPVITSEASSTKLILISTPNGMNHFYKFWRDSERNQNNFKRFEIKWNDVPGRDKEFKKSTIADIGIKLWRQEYECEWLGSSGTLIDGEKLEQLVIFDPIELTYNENFKIYEYPIENHSYISIVDTSDGLGDDSYTIQMIDVTYRPYRQVATFENNEIKEDDFKPIVKKISELYNEAITIVENNFNDLAKDLHDDYEYENIFYDETDRADRLGMRMTSKSKRIGNASLKNLIEEDLLILNDEQTINQLSTYIKIGSSYEAESGYHDDLITPLVLFGNFIKNKNFTSKWLEHDFDRTRKSKTIDEQILPIAFRNDCDGFVEIGEEEEEDDGFGILDDFLEMNEDKQRDDFLSQEFSDFFLF